MPYVVACPNCPARLKSQQEVPAGRTVTCPQCKTVFTLTEPSKLISDASSVLPGGPAKPTGSARKPNPVTDLNDTEVVDGADFEFNDRSKPKKRRDDDDFDDKPKSKKRRDDDDYDDRSKPKKRRDDDDFDDKPTGKKDRDDDDFDDHDDDGRRKKASKGKKNNKVLLLGLIGGAGAFVMLGILLLVLNLAGAFSLFGGGPSSDMLVWLPSDIVRVEGIDFAEVSKNSSTLKNARDDFSEVENSGIKIEDMVSGMFGKKSEGGAKEVTIVKLKAKADKDRIVKAVGGQELRSNSKPYYKTKSNGAVYFASDRLVIFSKSEAIMTSLLMKEEGKVVIPDDLKAAISSANGHIWLAAVGASANIFDAGNPRGTFAEMPKPSSLVANGKIAGVSLEYTFTMTCADSVSAKKTADTFEKLINAVKNLSGLGGMGKDLDKQASLKIFENAHVTSSGSKTTLTFTAPADQVGGAGFFP